ncbi:hypothetical protein B0H14DRAFT_3147324 [Mycena olivaceomarginata]|nr:hypothetical protein B0H14DRAFT_3147324 [Mycena olivaceomarginata]
MLRSLETARFFGNSKPYAVNLNLNASGFLFFAPRSPIFFDRMFRFRFCSSLRWYAGSRRADAIFQAWDDPFSSASASNEALQPALSTTAGDFKAFVAATVVENLIVWLYMQLVTQGFVLGSGFSIPRFLSYKHV